ncbi:Stage V sporulation protein D [Oceanibacterium hippocampi]|uniref:Stage V sporulation protein D n=2 Tax=Oceanibacterium hippocampi TaxID=745714 RepID=A0A1Y5TUS2_9PROT|nr:Stage V sporulation protein D [Oceanibacterium hippocampi]
MKTFTRRSLMLAGGKVALMSALVGRLYYLQVLQSNEFTMMAEENRISLRLLAPPRGRILDRFGAELATNRQNFRVVLIPEQTRDVGDTLQRLGQFVRIDEHDVERVLREVKRKRGFVPIPVVENLSWEEFASVNVRSPDLPGIQLEVGWTRDYPFGEMLAHTVGYVASVSERDLQEDNDSLLELPGYRIGKSGIEKTYDKLLRGKAGNSRVEVNAFGRVIREISRVDGQPGRDVVLSLDVALQEYAMHRLDGESAAVVVVDVHTGEVLSLASNPGFDPSAFNIGLSNKYWQSLIGNKLKPLTNKAVAGVYPPGSTFKMVVALAALESGAVGPGHTVYCPGHMQLGNHRFHCWKRGGHGTLDMASSLEQSCDVYFYDIAKRIGIERIAEMASRFGMGHELGIDLAGERSGLVPTKEWKQAVQGVAWQKGETLIAGIGQGFMLATPLQLAIMTARIASGLAVTPTLARRHDAPVAPSLGISHASLSVVREGMNRVINGKRGTARGARIKEEGWEMAGKTGTAQVRRISKAERARGVRKNEDKPWEERDHALFVAFAPVNEPRYAISVIVEHGGGGSAVAAPIARDILIEAQRLDPLGRPGRERFADLAADGGGSGG